MSSDSSDQATIEEFDIEETDDQDIAALWSPADGDDDVQHVCVNCGSHISALYQRHHADENGDVHRCPECSTLTERLRGNATDPEREKYEGLGQTVGNGGV